tara:strand:- start:7172 stop:7411 length:240 start_codon:yes stop_codon:yes gene_type:complete
MGEIIYMLAIIFGYSFIGAFLGFSFYKIFDILYSKDIIGDMMVEDFLSVIIGVFWPIFVPVASSILLALYCFKRIFPDG